MNKEEIIEKLLAGEMKLYQIDKFTENATISKAVSSPPDVHINI